MTADTAEDIKKKYIKYKTKYLNKKYLYLEQIISTDPNPDPYLKQLAYEIVDWINMFKLVKTKYPNSKLSDQCRPKRLGVNPTVPRPRPRSDMDSPVS